MQTMSKRWTLAVIAKILLYLQVAPLAKKFENVATQNSSIRPN